MNNSVAGETGFIGIHSVRVRAVSAGHEMIAFHWKNTSFARCTNFENKVTWLNHDAADRTRQTTNLTLSVDLLQIADSVGLKHFWRWVRRPNAGQSTGAWTEVIFASPTQLTERPSWRRKFVQTG